MVLERVRENRGMGTGSIALGDGLFDDDDGAQAAHPHQ